MAHDISMSGCRLFGSCVGSFRRSCVDNFSFGLSAL